MAMGLLAMAKVARVNRELKAKRAARMALERVRTLSEEQLCARAPSFLDSEYTELQLEVLQRCVLRACCGGARLETQPLPRVWVDSRARLRGARRLVQITDRQARTRNESMVTLLKNNSMARLVAIAAAQLGVSLLDDDAAAAAASAAASLTPRTPRATGVRMAPLAEQFLASVAPPAAAAAHERGAPDEELVVAALETLCNFCVGPRACLAIPIMLDLKLLQVRVHLISKKTEPRLLKTRLNNLLPASLHPQVCVAACTGLRLVRTGCMRRRSMGDWAAALLCRCVAGGHEVECATRLVRADGLRALLHVLAARPLSAAHAALTTLHHLHAAFQGLPVRLSHTTPPTGPSVSGAHHPASPPRGVPRLASAPLPHHTPHWPQRKRRSPPCITSTRRSKACQCASPTPHPPLAPA
jgi:hypothetical protein